jgi:hypothetical protein
MKRFNVLILLFFIFYAASDLYGIEVNNCAHLPIIDNQRDSIKENQILYNGRIWRNLYYLVQGDQFLFSKEFLPGSLSIGGKTYPNILLKYDIFSDEILTPIDSGKILQLNKELVDSFSVIFQDKKYRFTKIKEDSQKIFKSFVNVIYEGKTALYVKYNKKIDRSSIEGKSDNFYQTSLIYFVNDKIVYTISNKSDLFTIFKKDKAQIRDFIKKNKLKVSKKEPGSFAQIIIYYDSISR